MLWGVIQIKKQTRQAFRGSSLFRCLSQEDIEGALSILSTEQFFLTHRGVESRRDHPYRQLDNQFIKLFLALKVDYECSFNPCLIIRKNWFGFFYLNYPVLDFGTPVVTKPIQARSIRKLLKFLTSEWVYQIAIDMVAVCAGHISFASRSCQHDYWSHFQFI